MDIIEQLSKIGLKPKQASAYITLLRVQESSPRQIAEEAGLERSTIYKILEDLAEKGLATKVIRGKKINYTAESPLRLETLANDFQESVINLQPILMALVGKRQKKTQVKFYEGINGIKQVLLNSLNCQEKLRRDLASVENVVDFLGLRFINQQIKERVKKKIAVKSLRTKTVGDKVLEKDWFLRKDNSDLLREVRYLDKTIHIEPLIIIYDSTVAVISSKKESYALEIESMELSAALKMLFDIAWSDAK